MSRQNTLFKPTMTRFLKPLEPNQNSMNKFLKRSLKKSESHIRHISHTPKLIPKEQKTLSTNPFGLNLFSSMSICVKPCHIHPPDTQSNSLKITKRSKGKCFIKKKKITFFIIP